jgi:hypothetical protein
MDEPAESPQYPVSIWEGIAIAGGAILLVAVGVAGLGVKALGNAFNPQRAEAIARSLMSYEIPGGSTGFFGTNIGGGKMAVVTSVSSVAPAQTTQRAPEIELFLAHIPVNENPEAEADGAPRSVSQPENQLFSGFSFSYQDPASFQITDSRVEQKPFCGLATPVEIQQGTLTIADGAAPVPAVKYEVKRVIETETNIVTISALGDRAAEQATKVFNSLVCE